MHTTLDFDTTYHAIAAPARRAILDMLRAGERTVSDLVDEFDMSQPAISQHLKVLREAGLVSYRPQGRWKVYRLNAAPLREVHDWVSGYEDFWRVKLDALRRYLEETSAEIPEEPS